MHILPARLGRKSHSVSHHQSATGNVRHLLPLVLLGLIAVTGRCVHTQATTSPSPSPSLGAAGTTPVPSSPAGSVSPTPAASPAQYSNAWWTLQLANQLTPAGVNETLLTACNITTTPTIAQAASTCTGLLANYSLGIQVDGSTGRSPCPTSCQQDLNIWQLFSGTILPRSPAVSARRRAH